MIEIGQHRLLCGDITTGAVEVLMGEERADAVYVDPPWGPGNQQYWHTMRERGAAPRTDWPTFLEALCGAIARARRPEAPVFVEMGLRWTDDLDAAMRAAGLPLRRHWTISYGPRSKPLPNSLRLYGALDVPVAIPPEASHGEPATRTVLASVVRPGAIVLDPCTGLGMTARVTHALGGRFRGAEMTAARLERTAAWLRRAVTRAGRGG
jgi:hypothetical protein